MTGRFAPSPTGRMHLGNVFSALISWLSAKSEGDRWILRIEDLDPQRSRLEYARQIEDDLHWLGLDWDEGGVEGVGPNGPYMQSLRSDIYQDALRRLSASGLTYPCYCTRADIMATQAPHESDGRVVYAGTCRPPHLRARLKNPQASADTSNSSENSENSENTENSENSEHSEHSENSYSQKPVRATRLFVPDRDIHFADRYYGPQCVNLQQHCGDFILQRADGAWAYQLAVVVDDALMGVGEVVRGADLLLSSAQQIYLYELLGFQAPQFAHFPLICNESGQRLSKRDRSLAMDILRQNHSPQELIGRLAFAAGIIDRDEPASPSDLLPYFNWNFAPKASISHPRQIIIPPALLSR